MTEENEYAINNYVNFKGTVVSDLIQNYNYKDVRFYETYVEIIRLSGNADILPVTIPESLLNGRMLKVGDRICATGQLRSYNRREDDKSHLKLTIFVHKLFDEGTDKQFDINNIKLTGRICKPPIFRLTPFGREITDVILAVNRNYGKSDYIPCVLWGTNAQFVKDFKPSDKLFVTGRIQSRAYNKRISDDKQIQMTAYEVSVSMVEKL